MRSEAFWSSVRRVRTHRGVTVAELAGRAGITRCRLSRILNGRVDPRESEIRGILEALGLLDPVEQAVSRVLVRAELQDLAQGVD